MKRIIAYILVILMAVLFPVSCGRAVTVPDIPHRDPEEIIPEIVAEYGESADPESTEMITLLSELQAADPACAKLWQGILDFWQYTDSDLELNPGKLPDDLPDTDALCIVVLGYQLNPDGSMQNELIGRLKTALVCAEQYPKAYVLCTGGGTAYMNPAATEAQQMGDWLKAHGLDSKRLILEDQSLSTAENAAFSYEILQKKYPKISSAAIVTSSYHIPWGMLMFEAEFRMQAAAGAPELHVVSNCAYEYDRYGFDEQQNLRCQTAGMYELIGAEESAMKLY